MTFRATTQGVGTLRIIPDCFLKIPRIGEIKFTAMPAITDSKGASYNPQNIIGRSMPLLTYSHSEVRTIGLEIPLMSTGSQDSGPAGGGLVPGTVGSNLRILRAVQSTLYPANKGENGAPYAPPVVCELRCGRMLAGGPGSSKSVCVVCTKCSVKYDKNLPFDPKTLLPHKFTISTNWNVVYSSSDLPGKDRIFEEGR
jgi:hypothetical protein